MLFDFVAQLLLAPFAILLSAIAFTISGIGPEMQHGLRRGGYARRAALRVVLVIYIICVIGMPVILWLGGGGVSKGNQNPFLHLWSAVLYGTYLLLVVRDWKRRVEHLQRYSVFH